MSFSPFVNHERCRLLHALFCTKKEENNALDSSLRVAVKGRRYFQDSDAPYPILTGEKKTDCRSNPVVGSHKSGDRRNFESYTSN